MVYPYTAGSPLPEGTELLHLSPDPASSAGPTPCASAVAGDLAATLRRARCRSCASGPTRAAAADAVAEAGRPGGATRSSALEATATRALRRRADATRWPPPTPSCGRMPAGTAVVDEAITTGVLRPGLPPLDRAGTATSSARAAGSGWGMPAASACPWPTTAAPGAVRRRRRLGHVLAAGAVDRGPRALPVVFAVVNNRQYLILKDYLRGMGGDVGRAPAASSAMDLDDPPVDFVALAALDGRGRHVASTSAGDIGDAVQAAARRRAAPTCSSIPITAPDDAAPSCAARACGSSATAAPSSTAIDWDGATPASAGWCSGRNGSGKTTLLRIASLLPAPDGRGASRCSASGSAGSTCAAAGARIGLRQRRAGRPAAPRRSTALDVVMTAQARARSSRGGTRYDDADREPRHAPCSTASASAHLADRDVRHAVLGRAPAGAAGPDARRPTRAGAARRAHRRPRPRRPRGARGRARRRWPRDPTTPPTVLVTHHVDEIPPGFTHALLLATGRCSRRGSLDDVLTAESISDCVRPAAPAGAPARALLLSRALTLEERESRGRDRSILSPSTRSRTGPHSEPP